MIWTAYVVGVIALGVVLGRRLKQVREAHERLAAFQRRHLGL